ncbi:TPA: hypothetical protein ACGO97_000760 [Streptococcus suis]
MKKDIFKRIGVASLGFVNYFLMGVAMPEEFSESLDGFISGRLSPVSGLLIFLFGVVFAYPMLTAIVYNPENEQDQKGLKLILPLLVVSVIVLGAKLFLELVFVI